MDETRVRTELHRLADGEVPAGRVSIGRAITTGRRARRLRIAGAGGSTVAVLAVVAVAFALITAPGKAGIPGSQAIASASPAPQRSGPALANPPARFNPLVPYAAFGWLPAGDSIGAAGDEPGTTADATTLSAGGRGGWFELWVTAAGACNLPGGQLSCDYGNHTSSGQRSLTHRAPDVNGRPAYWDTGCVLMWQYAPDSWALMNGSFCRTASLVPVKDRAVMLRVAAGIRYQQTRRLIFPFWTDARPPGWQVTGTLIMEPPGQPAAMSVIYGPAADPAAAEVDVTPQGQAGTCDAGTQVTVDGVTGYQRTTTEPGKDWQQVCADDVHGFQIIVSLDLTAPGAARLGGALGIARQIHVLGTDPAGWTVNPLR